MTNKKKALLISCFDWYHDRLSAVAEVLSNQYRVTIVQSDYSHIDKCPVEDKIPQVTYIHVPEYAKNLSWARINSHLTFGRKIKQLLQEMQPDLIYLLVPPNNTAKHCLKYRLSHPNTKYIVDIIDLWPESMPLRGVEKTGVLSAWNNMRDSSLRYADYIFTECGLYQEQLASQIPDIGRASNLYLYKTQSKNEQDAVRGKLSAYSPEADAVRLAYLGSINSIIDIDKIKEIAYKLKTSGKNVSIKIIGDGENRDKLCSSLEMAGAQVFYYGKIFDTKKKIDLLADCDYGLNIMKDSVSVGLTIKSIDYLSMGLPLLNNIKGDTWHLVQSEGIGVNYQEDTLLDDIDKLDMAVHERAYSCYNRYFTREAFKSQLQKGLEAIE